MIAARWLAPAVVALALPLLGCQAILGIKEPAVRAAGSDAAAGGADAAAPSDGGARKLDAGAAAIPESRTGYALVYDATDKRLLLFGGFSDARIPLNDTWEWDGAGWIDVSPSSGNPQGRFGSMMAHDAARGRVVLFGGQSGTGARLDDTWEWDGVRWTNVTPASGSPPARLGGAMVYDAARQRPVLFGGSDLQFFNDTWEWDGARWTDVTPATGTPQGRDQFAMAYDLLHSRSVVFGGYDGSTADAGDTWTWDGTSWTGKAASAGDPSPRHQAAMAYDAQRQRVVLFSGKDASGDDLNDTWEWDGTSWSDVTPASGNPPPPSHQYEYAAAYDGAIGKVILYDGAGHLWAWDGSSWRSM